ncbi:hypothetical protein [Diaphorobacter sp. HDW4B]|uniref:DUF7657 domain-containing protein n=1 Tax=Diaphorobacter sp. HDW4B TaxID=2714925 RepID=UPI001F10FFDC|nr:hypothetical protein [Diaphorobacter sp. HDW4B]
MLIVQKVLKRHWLILVVIICAIVFIFFKDRKWTRRGGSELRLFHGNATYFIVAGIFALLVACGVTGSSVGWLLKSHFGQSFLDVQGNRTTLLKDRPVRGDEWGVQLPNVLAQIHHKPPFPVLNTNIGLGGQNMGVAGMTGVPVLQWAAIARPATWGYFFLPLRQAMSWQWQLPFWGGLLAAWCLLNLLRPDQRALNFGLSIMFSVAPYAAAWSNWPLYATMFPAFAFVVVAHLLRTKSGHKALLLGAILGWLLAAWFLVLYPTWLIVLASVLVFVGVGWGIEQRSQLRFGYAQLIGLGSALMIVGAILGSWWLDTRDAVALMQATEYPGRRGAMPGGDMSWWWHLRGYANVETVVRAPGTATNESEASSYFFLPLLLVFLTVRHFLRSTGHRWTVLACAAFIACFWLYCFVGVPVWLAKITLWGNMPTTRMDVGLGLATIVLISLVAGNRDADLACISGNKTNRWVVPAVLTLTSGVLVGAAISSTPVDFFPTNSPVYVAAMMIGGAYVCWWMARDRMAAAVAMMVVLHLMTSLVFNPISRAPRDVRLSAETSPFVTDSRHTGQPLRTLVVNGDGIGPLTLAAVGVPTVNSVLYYPHKAFWDKLGLPDSEWSKVNRYQHLGFYLDAEAQQPDAFFVVAAALDQVHVHVHPERFDFSRTGAFRVAAPSNLKQSLIGNRSLRWLGTTRGVEWFAVNGEAFAKEVTPPSQ